MISKYLEKHIERKEKMSYWQKRYEEYTRRLGKDNPCTVSFDEFKAYNEVEE